jgi:hypothetical protein
MVPRAQRPDKFRFPLPQEVPAWAARFFSLTELRRFYEAVEDALWRRGSWFDVRDGFLVVHLPTGDIAQCGLYNVALRCSTAPVAEYPALVEAHFKRCFSEAVPELDERERPATLTFADVRPALKVRLYSDAYLLRYPERHVQRKLAQGLNAVVVVDYPHMAAGLSLEILKALGGTEEEAFACALENSRDLPLTREPLPLEGCEGFALTSEGFYVTAQVLHLERHLAPEHLAGALVALPTRHTVLVCPVVAETLQTAISALYFVARGMYRDLAAQGDTVRLSKNLYWWAGGELVYVPVLGRPGRSQAVVVPPEFIERLLAGRLPQGARA